MPEAQWDRLWKRAVCAGCHFPGAAVCGHKTASMWFGGKQGWQRTEAGGEGMAKGPNAGGWAMDSWNPQATYWAQAA